MTGETGWEFPLAGDPEEIRAPRADHSTSPEERVSAFPHDDGLELRGAKSDEEWVKTSHPVISIYNYR